VCPSLLVELSIYFNWWLRAANFDGDVNFLIVGYNEYWYGSNSNGFVPDFRIG